MLALTRKHACSFLQVARWGVRKAFAQLVWEKYLAGNPIAGPPTKKPGVKTSLHEGLPYVIDADLKATHPITLPDALVIRIVAEICQQLPSPDAYTEARDYIWAKMNNCFEHVFLESKVSGCFAGFVEQCFLLVSFPHTHTHTKTTLFLASSVFLTVGCPMTVGIS